MKISKGGLSLIVILGVLIIDQILKIWVKTSFYLGESYHITDWFQLVFIENNGMAFGMELGSKLFLTLFRIVAVTALGYYITRIIKQNYIPKGYVVCCSLITAGAAGNIFDCLFYGLLFNNPIPPEVATFLPEAGGYASLFYGRVVDMFYFPLFSFNWPEWMPWVGGEHFTFFQPIFNFADAAITVGIGILIFFYSKYLGASANEQEVSEETSEE